jgi:hypothetical protein
MGLELTNYLELSITREAAELCSHSVVFQHFMEPEGLLQQ